MDAIIRLNMFAVKHRQHGSNEDINIKAACWMLGQHKGSVHTVHVLCIQVRLSRGQPWVL